jgi:hypothetical protein
LAVVVGVREDNYKKGAEVRDVGEGGEGVDETWGKRRRGCSSGGWARVSGWCCAWFHAWL